jgi:hypothetical protein
MWVVGVKVWGVGCGVWGVGCGVWGVGCGVWGVGCGVWGLRCSGDPDSPLHGYIFHKKTPTPSRPPQNPRHRPMLGSYGAAFSYGRGTRVGWLKMSTRPPTTSNTLPVNPSTLHPTPCILHPTLHTLHPTPCSLHPSPFTLHPTPFTFQGWAALIAMRFAMAIGAAHYTTTL